MDRTVAAPFHRTYEVSSLHVIPEVAGQCVILPQPRADTLRQFANVGASIVSTTLATKTLGRNGRLLAPLLGSTSISEAVEPPRAPFTFAIRVCPTCLWKARRLSLTT